MNSKVSIIIPYYKKRIFFLDTLKSVINQTYKNFEIIIIYDDESQADLVYLKKIIKFNKKIKLLINKKIWVPDILEIKALNILKVNL